jgi:hypothetical protein
MGGRGLYNVSQGSVLVCFDGFGPKRLDLTAEQGVLDVVETGIVAENGLGFELGSMQ